MQVNPLHLIIGQILEKYLVGKDDLLLLKDTACGGNQHIPLFSTPEKARDTNYCNVDLLILKNNRIKVIIEIEESNVKPTQVCGKILTSALTNCYIHESTNNTPIKMDQSVTFIQIVDSSRLNNKTKKLEQWHLLESSIRGILPLKNSPIKNYFLLPASKADFQRDSTTQSKLLSEIRAVLTE
jgi:hypothetical protein